MVDRPQALVLTYPHLFWTNVGGIQDNVADHSVFLYQKRLLDVVKMFQGRRQWMVGKGWLGWFGPPLFSTLLSEGPPV